VAKDISVSIDLDRLQQQVEEQKNRPSFADFEGVTSRSSVFVLGLDSRLSKQHVSSPTLTYIEVLKDGLGKPYTQINWEIKKEDLDSRRS
jgi:hypothetical protein